MDAPDDRETLAELLAANRELVEVNRQIAASLASLERLYAEDVGRRQMFQRRATAPIRHLQNPLRGWWSWAIFPILIVALLIGIPVITKWIGP